MRARHWGRVLVLILLLAPFGASAETLVEEDTLIEVDTTWTLAASPYVILGDVTVAEGVRLTVSAGATLLFEQGADLIVEGGLSVLGTEEDPVIITSLYDPELVLEPEASADWGGITLLGDTSSDVSHTLLRYAQDGLESYGTSLSLESVVFESGSGFLLIGAEAELTNVSFINTSDPLYLIGASVLASAVSIVNASGNAILAFSGSSFFGEDISIDGVEDEAVLAYTNTIIDIDGLLVQDAGGYGALTIYSDTTTSLHNAHIQNIRTRTNGIAVYGSSRLTLASTTIENLGTGEALLAFGEAEVEITDSLFHDGEDGGIEVYDATLSIANSSIRGFAGPALQAFADTTTVSIEDSYLQESRTGITAFSDAQVAITGSVISGNTIGVETYGTTTPVAATGNYWGDASGPYHATLNPSGVGNAVSNFTTFAPWLESEPLMGCVENCNSNVLFLPGLQSSKLYLAGERIWVPPLLHDNSQLFLNASGTPATAGVYTQDVLDEVLGANVYKSFVEMMDGLASSGMIEEWAAYPYDWRLDVNDIVANPTALENTVISLVAEVERLAASSRTDKVTIVAHSNGGLIGKLLISKLVEQGKGELVDKLVLVAVPQLGTPKAIASLAHGQGLPFEWLPVLLTKSDARTIAENMPSAYTLLPSAEYFARVATPVVEFASSTLTAAYRAQYGEAIDTRAELEQFLLGAEGRASPAPGDTFTPNVLNEYLLARARATQNTLDAWTPPAGLAVTQIVGWGSPTVAGIRYVERKGGGGVICAITSCSYLDNEPILTVDGDKTVVSPSAGMLGQEFYLNLKTLSTGANENRKHMDILEATPVLNFLENFFISNAFENEYITQTKPTPSASDKSLRMRVLSPVSIDLYDEFGNHTGIATSTSDGIPRIEENIPNSYYFEFGEGKYAGADSPNVKVYLNGQAEGTFTLDIENVEGDTVVSSSSFVNVPVTSNSFVALDISEGQSVSLQLDSAGDGSFEESIAPGEYIAPVLLVEAPRASSGGHRSSSPSVVTKAVEKKEIQVEEKIQEPVAPVVAVVQKPVPVKVAQSPAKSVVEQNLQARAQTRSLAATAEALPKGFFKGLLSKLPKWLKVWSW